MGESPHVQRNLETQAGDSGKKTIRPRRRKTRGGKLSIDVMMGGRMVYVMYAEHDGAECNETAIQRVNCDRTLVIDYGLGVLRIPSQPVGKARIILINNICFI